MLEHTQLGRGEIVEGIDKDGGPGKKVVLFQQAAGPDENVGGIASAAVDQRLIGLEDIRKLARLARKRPALRAYHPGGRAHIVRRDTGVFQLVRRAGQLRDKRGAVGVRLFRVKLERITEL